MSTIEQVQDEEPQQLNLAIPDVYIVSQALDAAIQRKIFSEEEIKKIYGPWSRVMRFCEDIKRKTLVEQLYKKEEEPKLEKVEEETSELEK